MPDPMTATEWRRALLDARTELIAAIHEMNRKIDVVTNALHREADVLAEESWTEQGRNAGKAPRKMTYTATNETEPEQGTQQPPRELPTTPPPKEPGKRYCGNCGFPGHRAKNCDRPTKKTAKKGAK